MMNPGLEERLRHCREYKMRLDRKRRLVRTAMLCPPVLVVFWGIVSFIRAVCVLITRESGDFFSVGGAAFLAAAALGVFAAGETMLEKKEWIEISGPFYGIAAGVCAVLAPFFFDSSALLAALAAYCLIAALLNLLFRRLYEENQTMRRLKGYPHFDPLRMSEAELCGEEAPASDPLERLSPEERIMRDRGDMRF